MGVKRVGKQVLGGGPLAQGSSTAHPNGVPLPPPQLRACEVPFAGGGSRPAGSGQWCARWPVPGVTRAQCPLALWVPRRPVPGLSKRHWRGAPGP